MPNIVQQYTNLAGQVLYTLYDDGSATLLGAQSSNGGTGLGGRLTKVSVTSAQLLALKATPVVLLPAPGAGKAIQLLGAAFHYNFLTGAYTLNAGTLKAYLGAVASAKPLTIDVAAGLIDQVANRAWEVPILSTGALTDAQGVNVDVELGNAGAAEFTVGAGTLDVYLSYTIITL
jgi:hypothetical protein